MSDQTPAFYQQDETWKQNAACKQADIRLFFPERGDPVVEAKKICASCPVQQQCLDYALAIPNIVGIWGGMSGKERRTYRRQQRIQNAAKPIVHGTPAGYRAEKRRNLPPCDACLTAHRNYERERSRKYRNPPHTAL